MQEEEEKHYINHGAVRRETKPNGHRRAFAHDYREAGTYMVTIVTEGRAPAFGHLEGSALATKKLDHAAWVHEKNAPHIVLSELGRRVFEEEVPKISRFYPQVEVWRVAMMPDHIHLLLRVKERLPEGKHLGQVVRGFKTGCTRAWWALQDADRQPGGEAPGTVAAEAATKATTGPIQTTTGAIQAAAGPAETTTGAIQTDTGATETTTGAIQAAAGPIQTTTGAIQTATGPAGATTGAIQTATGPAGAAAKEEVSSGQAIVPEAFPSGNIREARRPLLFAPGYHDRILCRPGMLDNIKRYMLENPLRARIRQECPRLMERRLHLWINGREYAAFGNLFLLKYPLKEQVFLHRYTQVEASERQAILASAQLSEKEQQHLEIDPQRMPTHLTAFYARERARLLQTAEEGTVLVTPGISRGESLVVQEAIDSELPLILLQSRPIGPYWKPDQQRFFACSTGSLLILSPWELEGVSDYEHFHRLNDLAREICETTEVRIMDYSKLRA